MVRNTPARLIAILLAMVLAAGGARADQREDFLAGKTRSCPRCDLTGQNFKRRDLTGADLTGAKLKDANFHDARSPTRGSTAPTSAAPTSTRPI